MYPDRVEEYRQSYLQGAARRPDREVLVRELANHAAATDLWNEAVGAIERQGVRELPKSPTLASMTGAACMKPFSPERCPWKPWSGAKSSCGAFARLPPRLAKLEELQARRREAEAGELEVPPNPFTTEAACETYLAERFKTGNCSCPRCGSGNGRHISSHRCWEWPIAGARPGCGTAP